MSTPIFTVALAGPDGAGKSTLTRRLEQELPIPAKYVYMGVNLESSNLVLPTTRLLLEIKRALGGRPDIAGPLDPDNAKPRSKSPVKRALKGLKSSLRITNQIAEEWFRQSLVWLYQRRGFIVLFDRHFYYDYYFHDIAVENPQRSLASRIHGFMLDRLYPKPDFVIFLDAPAEVLYARKRESSVEILDHRRREYLRLREIVKNSVLVDASKPQDEVLQEVSSQIMAFYHHGATTVDGLGWKIREHERG